MAGGIAGGVRREPLALDHVEIELDATKPFDRVVLAEPIKLGQRVRAFRISIPAPNGAKTGEWTTLAEGTTVGHKRIVRVAESTATRVRIEILAARACPALSSISVHKTTQ